jgi:aspartate kinase
VTVVVQKYGGTSVADTDRLRAVAEHIAFTRRQGHDVVVVVSAMGKETDNLLALAGQVSTKLPGRELDMLLTVGERKSMALLCMALAGLDVDAVSFTGSQVGIITDNTHGRAKILEVRGDRVREALAEGRVCVIAGFQGQSIDREITTLGRGGSDTTAVAVAAALGADVCEIYTDVTGVFSADPRLVPQAHKLHQVSFEEMLEMAATGGRVLALRSVEFARNHGVTLHVRSSFTWEPGTWVTPEEPSMEDPIISGVTHDDSEAKVTVGSVPDRPGIAAVLFRALADAGVNIDMIVQNTSTDGATDISFTMPQADMAQSEEIVARVAAEIGAGGVTHDADIAKVSLVGAGMRTSPGVAATMFETLAAENINIEMISTSTIRISVIVARADMERALRALHTAFGLDSGESYSSPLPERR